MSFSRNTADLMRQLVTGAPSVASSKVSDYPVVDLESYNANQLVDQLPVLPRSIEDIQTLVLKVGELAHMVQVKMGEHLNVMISPLSKLAKARAAQFPPKQFIKELNDRLTRDYPGVSVNVDAGLANQSAAQTHRDDLVAAGSPAPQRAPGAQGIFGKAPAGQQAPVQSNSFNPKGPK